MISIGALAAGLVIVVASATTIISSNVAVTGHEYLPTIAALDSNQEIAKFPTQTTYQSGDYIGKLSIPRLKKTILVYQGTNTAVLRRGAGHYINSVIPGVKDNSVIAGHRDSVFRDFGKLKRGDLLYVTIANSIFTYKIKSLRVVDADDRTVIVPTALATLTLSTCYPFRYIGNAPDRFIVTALLTK
jgi:sortase A